MTYNRPLHLILSRIYILRTLSYYQVRNYVLEDNTESYVDKVLKTAVSKKYIEKIGRLKKDSYYLITRLGISYLKEYGIIEINTRINEFVSRPIHYLTAGQLAFKPVYKNHQIALNEFVLKFAENFENMDFKYCDEKNVTDLIPNIRPDGILFFDDTMYFLEMDMNTERAARLKRKWQNYRYFIQSTEFTQLDFDIKVLFILGGNVTSSSERKYFLWKLINDNLGDAINDRFNFYVDTEDILLDLITDGIADNNKAISHNIKYDEIMEIPGNDREYKYFIFKKFDGLKTIRDIFMFAGYRAEYKVNKGMDLNLVVVLERENDAIRIMDILYEGRENDDSIFFTTLERLEKNRVNDAMFSVSNNKIIKFTGK